MMLRFPLVLFVQARHTGIKIVQQIAILLGCGVLPHLKALVDIVKHGLTDENQKVRHRCDVTRQDCLQHCWPSRAPP